MNLFNTYGTRHWEDNVTRALLVTLKHMKPAHVREALSDILRATRLGPEMGLDPQAEGELQFRLQVGKEFPDEDRLDAATGAILGIKVHSAAAEIVHKDVEGGARPDALIEDLGNEFTIVIESKLWGDQYSAQISRHFRMCFDSGVATQEDVWGETTWDDVASALERIAEDSTDGCERLFIHEFVEYLDDLRLISFRALRSRDFERGTNIHRLFQRLLPEATAEDGVPQGIPGILPYADDQRVEFERTRNENVWVRFDKEPALRLGIVCGGPTKARSRKFMRRLSESPWILAEPLGQLSTRLSEMDLEAEITVASMFYHSRFRNRIIWLNERFGLDEYDAFVVLFTDRHLNAYDRVPVRTLRDRFAGRTDAKRLDDLLSKQWQDVDEYLQYLYFHVDVGVPGQRLVGKEFEDVKEVLDPLLVAMRDAAIAIDSRVP